MSILDEQLIGEGKLTGSPDVPPLKRNPFSAGDTDGEQVPVGFGGYTYAKDETQQGVFSTTETRTGPQGDVVLNQGSKATQYGPDGRRMGDSDDQTTLLGQMAKMMGEGLSWSTANGGKKIAYSFTNSDELKSFRDHTVTGTQPTASGGPTGGFDADRTYGITNWIATGGTGTAGEAATDEVRVYFNDADGKRNPLFAGDTVVGDTTHTKSITSGVPDDATFLLAAAKPEVLEEQLAENVQNPGGISTGLRGLPDNGAQQSG